MNKLTEQVWKKLIYQVELLPPTVQKKKKKLAEQVWKKLNFHEQAIRRKDILQFVEHTMTVVPANLKSDWLVCFAACSHSLWKARNHQTFQQKSYDDRGNTASNHRLSGIMGAPNQPPSPSCNSKLGVSRLR